MSARHAVALPVLVLGGLLWGATMLATIAVELYLTYVAIKQGIDGDIGQGLATFFGTTTVAMFVLFVLSIPGAALMAAGEHLWGSQRPTAPSGDTWDV